MPKTAINNVLVFGGENSSKPKTITIDGTLIGDAETGAADVVVDGSGGTLLPGFFDCHVHVDDVSHLALFTSFGITTVCDMGSVPFEKYSALR